MRNIKFLCVPLLLMACEVPDTGQVMCWQDTTVSPPELVCVPVRSMRGLPIPEGAFIVENGGEGNGSVIVSPEVPPAPPPAFEYTNPSTAYQVNGNGGFELSTTENGPSAVSTSPSGEVEGGSLEEHMENLQETLESLL